jgi:hypothetical protein
MLIMPSSLNATPFGLSPLPTTRSLRLRAAQSATMAATSSCVSGW